MIKEKQGKHEWKIHPVHPFIQYNGYCWKQQAGDELGKKKNTSVDGNVAVLKVDGGSWVFSLLHSKHIIL